MSELENEKTRLCEKPLKEAINETLFPPSPALMLNRNPR